MTHITCVTHIRTTAYQVGVDMVSHILSFKLGMVKANYTKHYCPVIKYPYNKGKE